MAQLMVQSFRTWLQSKLAAPTPTFPGMAPKKRALEVPKSSGSAAPTLKRRHLPVPTPARTPSPSPKRLCRTRTLGATQDWKRRLRRTGPPRHEVPNLETSWAHEPPLDFLGDESDATTSDEELSARATERSRLSKVRALAKKVTRRQMLMDSSDAGHLTFLENSAVKDSGRYYAAINEFLSWPSLLDVKLVEDAEVDAACTTWANEQYRLGKAANKGEVLLASIGHCFPEFSSFGSHKLPRFRRALKGWRRRTPARSRRPHVWSMWSMLAWHLFLHGHWLMGIYILWCVCLYTRPSELLSVRRRDIQRPVKGMTSRYQLLLFPEERPSRSKTYAANDTIEMHCEWAPWLEQTAAALADGNPNELVFPFSYPEFVTEVQHSTKKLKVKMVPYEARHSGPSIDAARLCRSRQEIKARGRWAQDRSVLRYEQRARLVRSFNELSAEQQALAERCEEMLEAMILGRCRPEALALPATLA